MASFLSIKKTLPFSKVVLSVQMHSSESYITEIADITEPQLLKEVPIIHNAPHNKGCCTDLNTRAEISKLMLGNLSQPNKRQARDERRSKLAIRIEYSIQKQNIYIEFRGKLEQFIDSYTNSIVSKPRVSKPKNYIISLTDATDFVNANIDDTLRFSNYVIKELKAFIDTTYNTNIRIDDILTFCSAKIKKLQEDIDDYRANDSNQSFKENSLAELGGLYRGFGSIHDPEYENTVVVLFKVPRKIKDMIQFVEEFKNFCELKNRTMDDDKEIYTRMYADCKLGDIDFKTVNTDDITIICERLEGILNELDEAVIAYAGGVFKFDGKLVPSTLIFKPTRNNRIGPWAYNLFKNTSIENGATDTEFDSIWTFDPIENDRIEQDEGVLDPGFNSARASIFMCNYLINPDKLRLYFEVCRNGAEGCIIPGLDSQLIYHSSQSASQSQALTVKDPFFAIKDEIYSQNSLRLSNLGSPASDLGSPDSHGLSQGLSQVPRNFGSFPTSPTASQNSLPGLSSHPLPQHVSAQTLEQALAQDARDARETRRLRELFGSQNTLDDSSDTGSHSDTDNSPKIWGFSQKPGGGKKTRRNKTSRRHKTSRQNKTSQ